MSDDYDTLIELSAEDVAKAADEMEKREAEILRLRTENEKLRAALKPFADRGRYAERVLSSREEWPVYIEELRAAAAALKETGDD